MITCCVFARDMFRLMAHVFVIPTVSVVLRLTSHQMLLTMENSVKSTSAKAWFARMVEFTDATGGTLLKGMSTSYLIHVSVKMDSVGNIVKLIHATTSVKTMVSAV